MKVEKKKVEKKVIIIEYFTDEMHKKIFPFQDRPGKTLKPIMKPVKFSISK
jgi:hypothetical protein